MPKTLLWLCIFSVCDPAVRHTSTPTNHFTLVAASTLILLCGCDLSVHR